MSPSPSTLAPEGRRVTIDLSPLRDSPAFRRIFIARTISILGLGMLAVAVPVQVFALTGSTLQVGLVATIEGVATFLGLLLGGGVADRFDRRSIIVWSRIVGGLGFALLAVNAWLPLPSVAAIFTVGAIDGFAGGLSVTALMAVTPALVPRDKLAAAGALNMLSVRLGTMVSPAIGGVVIALWGVGWNYAIAATGTLVTVLVLLGLPRLRPERTGAAPHPLRSIVDGAAFVYRTRIVRSIVLLGTLETLTSGVRVLLPALAVTTLGGGPAETGLLFAAVPVGAVCASLLSGWLGQVERPGLLLLALTTASLLSFAALGLARDLVTSLVILAVFGGLSSLGGVLQFALVQAHTPDRFLGRVNGLWMAQEVGGESVGALGLGALGRVLAPSAAILAVGAGAAALAVLALVGFRDLRRAPALTLTDAPS